MNTVTVSFGTDKLDQIVRIGKHQLFADEPVDLGGGDLGPSPFEYLAAALGTCTTITLKMYATRKNWPLENAIVNVTVDRNTKEMNIERKIQLVGALSEEQLSRLMEIANSCPVHKALHNKINITTVAV